MDLIYDEEVPKSKDNQLSEPEPSNHRSSLWQCYQKWVQNHKNRDLLLLADEAISRTMWWFPHSPESSSSGWREVVWGLLELHRLAMDLAIDTQAAENSYGTTISVKPNLPATKIRIALTVLQCIWPVSQELVRTDEPITTTRRQASVRLLLEQIRFALRLVLLVSYWRQMKKESLTPGILQCGGLFHALSAPNLDQERARLDRIEYVGRRTGRRVVTKGRNGLEATLQQPDSSSRLRDLRLLLGELLYIFRPLFWAHAEARNNPSQLWKAWIASLGIDVASLAGLHSLKTSSNAVTRNEWNRRRLRLLLYLMRSPVWERFTSRTIDRACYTIELLPLFGRILTAYLKDWIYYLKVYRAEQG